MNKIKIETHEGKTFFGSPDSSILDTALRTGLKLEHSCNTGLCGVCKIELLSGEVTELKSQLALTDLDRTKRQILSCCCSPKTDLLIVAEDLVQLNGINLQTLPCRIKEITRLTKNLVKVCLRFPPTSNFNFVEGQYIDVIGPNGIKRSYSIASTAKNSEVELYIKRFDNGLMSDYWFEKAKENDLLRIEGPKGTFFLRNRSADLIFLATGTGIAPILSILRGLDDDPNFVQANSIKLYWGNRFIEDFFLYGPFKNIKVEIINVLSRETSECGYLSGYVQDIALMETFEQDNTEVYACGSNTMIVDAKKKFIKAGIPQNKFYSDAFLQSY